VGVLVDGCLHLFVEYGVIHARSCRRFDLRID
jgi:hypothetical protein